MDALRIRRFKDRALAARRRLVAVAVVAALATISLIGSSAQATTPAATGTGTRCLTQEELFAAQCILIAKLFQAANQPDLSPKDMQLAAPGGVVAATSTTPRDVQRWRPNPQSWIDAKGRLAAGSGLTSKDIAATARWAPKLSKGVPVAGWLTMGAEIAYTVRDGLLMPSLGIRSGTVEESFCVREGNIATDLLGGLAGAGCAEWRLKRDYTQLVGGDVWQVQGDVLGVTYQDSRVVSGTQLVYCWMNPNKPNVTGFRDAVRAKWGASAYPAIEYQTKPILIGTHPASGLMTPNNAIACSGKPAHPDSVVLNPGVDRYPVIRVVYRDNKGLVTGMVPAEETGMTGALEQESAEWLTRVDCADGTRRFSVSEAFQQTALGEVSEPEAVQLEGCRPVSVGVAAQPKGTGIVPDAPWQPEPAPGASPNPTGTTTAAPPAEVPEEVKDWMTNFPQCWDGSCRLTLKKVTESTTEVDCFTVPAECVDWYEESASNPTKYKCYYAGQARALSDCFVYSRVFDKGKVQEGTGYGDPATGGDPGTGTGTKTNPGAALVAMREPVQNPSGDRQCWPTGWAAFNPFEWVFQPVRCALEWAFVPREAKLVQVQTAIKLAATNSRPGEMVQSISGWADAVNDIDPSGCAGPAVNLNLMGIVYSGHPLSACAEPAATLAWWSKLIIGVSVALAAALAITRYLGLQFGFSGVGRSPGGDS